MRDRQRIAWVAKKQVNWPRTQELLLLSEQQNQWSNFGPVSRILEQRLAEILDLDPSMRVVATSSGTAALDAISALEEYKLGRAPRWAVSSFGFHCTRLGPFRNAHIVDCDEDAVLDLGALSHIDVDDYDGVLMTNVFGTLANISRIVEFATERNKLFVADSAAAFDAAHRGGAEYPTAPEALSFHHTKPWGFGEGGAMIVAADDEGFARSVINFGLVSNRPVAAVATNAKMSEVAAAFIVSWLDSIEVLREQTQEQFERIRAVAEDQGWRTLGAGAGANVGLPPCVALVAPRPVSLRDFDAAPFVCRKYYEPLASTPVATRLFERMLNVPCHTEMSSVSDSELRHVLSLS